MTSAGAVAATGDLSGAYQLAYDAFRKSAASLLAVQGLRATSRGGHVADPVAAASSAHEAAVTILGRGVLTPW